MTNKLAQFFMLLLATTTLAACQADSRQQILSMDKSQVALRTAQSRAFDTSDTTLTVRTVIATLQDLSFTIDKVDNTLGLVSATKAGNSLLRMTVTVRPRGSHQIIVRASAQERLNAISDAVPYQQFFDNLAQALFLEAHEII
ncbi:MAG: hypothetical protein OQK24_02180 [Magnetovibrio sp.]|nr:hypothetical protein [Magnetovibrio sp.]